MLRFTSLGLRTLPRAPPLSRATLAVTLPRGFHNQPTSRTEQPVLESGTHTVDSAIHAGKMPGLWADIFAKREELRFKWWLVGAVAVAGGFMLHVEVSRQVAPVTLALAKLETRMETKFEGMETKFEGIDARFEVLEGLVRELGQDMAVLLDRTGSPSPLLSPAGGS